MRDKPHAGAPENQDPFNLAGCRWSVIPGTAGTRILVPSKAAAERLGDQLNISSRLAATRAAVLKKLKPGEEGFGQSNYAVGGHLYVSISVLVSSEGPWRGGWLLFRCPVGQEELFQNYLKATRTDIVAGLRTERASGGSLS